MSATRPADVAAAFAWLVRWRRDVRRFRPDPVPDDVFERCMTLAGQAPSVGLSQPWRFVRVDGEAPRGIVRESFERENANALAGYEGEDARLYASLKLAGLDVAPIQLAAFCETEPEKGKGLGRQTMPETLAYSTVCAIHTFWLAARAEGVGVGWLSILDPAEVTTALDVPHSWRLVGYLCVGYPEEDMDEPELEQAGWERRDPPTIYRR